MKPIIIILIILRVKHYLSTPTSGSLINFEKGTTSGVSKNSWENGDLSTAKSSMILNTANISSKPYGENLIAGLEGKVDLFEEKFKKSKALCGSQLEENINRLKLMLKKVQICFDYKNLIGLQKKLNFGEFDEILKESEANNYEQIQFESIVFEILDRSLEHNLLEFSSREKVIFFRRKTLLLLANDIFSKWSAKPELNGLLHVLDPREQMLSERRLTHILKVMDKEQWKILELAFLSNYMEWYRSSIKISDSINEELESLISDLGKKNPFRVEYWWEQLGTMRGSEINFAPAQIGNLFLYSMLKYQGRFYPENKLSFEFEKRFKYFESSVELLHTIIIFFRSMNISITKLYFFTDGISPMIEAYKVLISSKTIIKGSKKRTREGSEQMFSFNNHFYLKNKNESLKKISEKISKNHSKLLNGVISSTYKEFGNWINANFMARFLAQLSVSVHYLKAGNLDLDLKKELKSTIDYKFLNPILFDMERSFEGLDISSNG